MKNIKLIGVKMRVDDEKNDDGTTSHREILETKYVDNLMPCKQCNKNKREYGSSRCSECTKKYRIGNIGRNRLNRMVDKARQENKLEV